MRRFRNMLGRTMWDFTGAVAGYRRFLILGHSEPGMTAARDAVSTVAPAKPTVH